MLSSIKFMQCELKVKPKIDWIIAGPETGPGARPTPEGAIEDLYLQAYAAGVPFFDKRKEYLTREMP
jgi:protein gp37